MANYQGGARGGGKTFHQQQTEQEMLRMMREKSIMENARQFMRAEYAAAGFYVDTKQALKRMPFIDVVAKEAKVDKDFYDRGDDFT